MRDESSTARVQSWGYIQEAGFACRDWAAVFHVQMELAMFERQTAEHSARMDVAMQLLLFVGHYPVASDCP
jgi:hypothetical protein